MTKLFVRAHLLFHDAQEGLRRLRGDRKGVSTIEYAALAFGVIAAVAGVAALLSGGFNNLFGRLNNRIANIT